MNFFQTLIGSFHSAALYRQVRASSRLMVGYALLVVMLFSLASSVYLIMMAHRGFFAVEDGKPALFDSLVLQVADQLPVMTLKDHVLSSSSPTPTVIKISGTVAGLPFSDVAILTIDTSGKTTYANMQTPALITNHEFIFRTSEKTEIKSLAELTKEHPGTLVIDKAMIKTAATSFVTFIHKNLATIYAVMGTVLFLILTLGFFIARLCMLAILAGVGMFLGMVMKSPITYSRSFALAAVSYTPVALFSSIMTLALPYTPHGYTLLIAGIVALAAAIHGSKQPESRRTT